MRYSQSKIEEKGENPRNLIDALRETALAISSTLELPELLNLILQEISRMIAFDSASITLLDGEEFYVAASRDFDHPEYVAKIRFPSKISGMISPNLLALQTCKSVRIENVPGEYPDFVQPHGKRILSWLGIPLYAQNDGIGTLNLDSHSYAHFSDEDEKNAEHFAAQVSIALQNAKLYRNMKELANRDEFTGLYNRRYLQKYIKNEIKKLNSGRDSFSVIMVDLDFFKSVNDTYGHLIGDRVLYQAAQICMNNVREQDIVSRFGGDEFLILLPETNLKEAEKMANKIKSSIENKGFSVVENQINITVSLGVSQYIKGESEEKVISRADDGLHYAKHNGKNQVIVR